MACTSPASCCPHPHIPCSPLTRARALTHMPLPHLTHLQQVAWREEAQAGQCGGAEGVQPAGRRGHLGEGRREGRDEGGAHEQGRLSNRGTLLSLGLSNRGTRRACWLADVGRPSTWPQPTPVSLTQRLMPATQQPPVTLPAPGPPTCSAFSMMSSDAISPADREPNRSRRASRNDSHLRQGRKRC